MIPNSDIIPFGEWKPDQADLGGNARTVLNVLSNGDSYKPFPDLSDISDALGSRAYNGFSFLDPDGNVATFAATATDLFQLSGASWTNVSKSAAVYTTAVDGRWEFKVFGNEVLATNFVDEIQSFVVGTSTKFADLGGTPPRVKHFDIINDFLVTGSTFDGIDGTKPERIRWPGIGTTTSWAISAATQADFQDLVGNGGEVQAIVGSQNYGVVIQERNIWRMEFVGPPTVFNFTLAEENRGTKTPGSVVADGRFVYYLGEDGFFVFDGTNSIPIGNNKIDATFLVDFDENFSDRVSAAVDPFNKIVVWSYTSVNATAGEPDKLIIYNWTDQRWTEAGVTMEVLFQALSSGLTLDQLDTINTSVDALPASLDSRIWAGGKTSLAAFSSNNKLGFFTGANLDATIDTTEARLNGNGRSFVSSVTPVVDNSAATVALGTRRLQSDTVSFNGAVSIVAATGECPFQSDSVYHRARVNLTGSWNDAIGVRFRAVAKGSR